MGGASCHVKAEHKQPVLKCMMGRGGENKEWAVVLGRKEEEEEAEEQGEEQIDGQEEVKEEVGGTVQSGGQWKQEGGSGSEKSSSRRGSY